MFLSDGIDEELIVSVRRHQGTGRPLASEGFVKRLELDLGRNLCRKKPGPKPKDIHN
jgi:putative transposase